MTALTNLLKITTPFEVDDIINSNQPLTVSHDALALSWAAYRASQVRGSRDYGWAEGDLLPEDHAQAAATRRYYGNRITMQCLKGAELTQFKKDLYKICQGGVMLESHRGMLCQLPYFYHEDTAMDQLRQDFGSSTLRMTEPTQNTVTLTPVRKIFKLRRRLNTVEYWFKNAQDQLFQMDVDERNVFYQLIQGLYSQPQLRLTATMWPRIKLDVKYYKMINVVLAQ